MTDLALSAPRGTLPILQYMPPASLAVDPSYQRALDTPSSQKLIRDIARDWDWALCLPLVVSRRDDGGLFVVDGQHRHAAAVKRGDIQVLPCVIIEGTDVALEARTFVRLNKNRRPISKLDEFNAAVASGDSESAAIAEALARAGLSLAPNTNPTTWKPGQVAHIGGIQRAWREHGPFAAGLALEVLAEAYPDEVLRFAGTIYPGIAAITAEPDPETGAEFSEVRPLIEMVASRSQAEWRRAVLLNQAETPGTSPKASAVDLFDEAWAEALGDHLAAQLTAEELEAA